MKKIQTLVAVAGLVAVTPASGFAGPMGSIVLGLVAGVVCFIFCTAIKNAGGYDDSLDVFAVHGVGGILGTLLIPFLASFGPLAPGLGDTTFADKLLAQMTGVVSVCLYSGILSAGILLTIRRVIALRVSAEDESNGLDSSTHGESAHGYG